jgi:hypothetical protein
VVDKTEIIEQLHFWFELTNDPEVEVTDTGLVNIKGSAAFKGEHLLPNGKLPFAFGTVSGNLRLPDAGLASLWGMPKEVGDTLSLSRNPLRNLIGCTQKIHNDLRLRQMPELVSLEGFPTELGGYVAIDYKPELPLLRTLQARDGIVLWPVGSEHEQVELILEKYKGQGKRGAIRCQKELIAAGFEGNAQW